MISCQGEGRTAWGTICWGPGSSWAAQCWGGLVSDVSPSATCSPDAWLLLSQDRACSPALALSGVSWIVSIIRIIPWDLGGPAGCGPPTHLACPLLALVTFPPAATRWLSGHPTSSCVPVDGPGPRRARLLPHTSLWSQVNAPSLQERGLDLPSKVDRGHGVSVIDPSTTCCSALIHTIAFCPRDLHVQPCVGLTCVHVHVEPQACFAGAGWLCWRQGGWLQACPRPWFPV